MLSVNSVCFSLSVFSPHPFSSDFPFLFKFLQSMRRGGRKHSCCPHQGCLLGRIQLLCNQARAKLLNRSRNRCVCRIWPFQGMNWSGRRMYKMVLVLRNKQLLRGSPVLVRLSQLGTDYCNWFITVASERVHSCFITFELWWWVMFGRRTAFNVAKPWIWDS